MPSGPRSTKSPINQSVAVPAFQECPASISCASCSSLTSFFRWPWTSPIIEICISTLFLLVCCNVAAVLMGDMMDELHKEAQCSNQQANGDDNEGGRDRSSARLVETWCLWLIGHWFDLFQVAQIMEEIAH